MKLETIRQNYDFFSSGLYETYLNIYYQYLLNPKKRTEELNLTTSKKKWKSNIVIGVIQKSVSVMFTGLYDNDKSFNITPANGYGLEDDQTAEIQTQANKVKQMLENIYDITEANDVLFDACKDSILLGNGYFKLNYKKKNIEVEYFNSSKKVKKVLSSTENPTIDYVSPFRFFFDPVASSLETARYMGERMFLSLDEVIDRYATYLKGKEGKELDILKNKIKENHRVNRLSDDDFELRKKQIMVNTSMISYSNIDVLLTPSDETYETIEVYTKTAKGYRLYLYVESILIYEGPSIYPINLPPYQTITYNKVPGCIIGLGLGYLLYDIQLMINAMWNMHIDTSILSSVPVFIKKESFNDGYNQGDEKIELEPGKVIKTDIDGGFTTLKIEKFSNLIDNVNWLMQEMASEVGLSELAMGTQGKVDRNAASVNTKMAQYKARLRPISDSISLAMKNVALFWVAFVVTRQGDKISGSFLNINGVKITIEDLTQQYNYSFAINGLHTASKEVMRKQIIDGIPAMMNIRDNVTGLPVVDSYELGKMVVRSFDMSSDIIKTTEDLVKEKNEIDTATMKNQMEMEKMKQAEAPQQPQAQPQAQPQVQAGQVPPTPKEEGLEVADLEQILSEANNF